MSDDQGWRGDGSYAGQQKKPTTPKPIPVSKPAPKTSAPVPVATKAAGIVKRGIARLRGRQ